MADLVVRGGTVVTATGSRRADVAVEGGRIAAIEPDLAGLAATAGEVVDATGLLVLPGAIDAHTHTRVAIDGQPDRFFQDSVAAAFGGTTTFLAFNNPGTGSSPAAERSLLAGLREWRRPTAGDSAIDYGVSLVVSGRMDDPIAELPAVVEAGVPTCKAFMVFDFRLDDRRLYDAMRVMGERGALLEVHCEDPVLLDAAVDAAAVQRGDVLPRYHATTRPSYVEAVATARALAFGRTSGAPVHVVHLSSADALREVRRGRADGVRVSAETCPHYLVLTEERYDGSGSGRLRAVHDRAAASLGGGPRRAVGRAGRRLARPGRQRPRPRPPGGREGRGRQRRAVQPDQQRSAGDRDPAVAALLRGCRPRSDHRRAAWSTSWRRPRRDASASSSKGALEVGKDADLVLFDPDAAADDPEHRPAPLERLHPVRRDSRSAVACATSSCAAGRSSARARSSDGAASGHSWSAGCRTVERLGLSRATRRPCDTSRNPRSRAAGRCRGPSRWPAARRSPPRPRRHAASPPG